MPVPPRQQQRNGQQSPPPAAGGGAPGIPENYDIVEFEGFDGLNTKPTRPAIGDQELSWCDNFMPLGKNNLVAMPGIGPAIYSSSGIVRFKFFNIGTVQQCIAFKSDGSAAIFNATSGAVLTNIAASTFPAGGAVACQWGRQYLLILATNGYWIWDGSVLYAGGTLGPQVTILSGGSVGGTPTVGFQGGSGSGAAASATVSNGAVSAVTISNPGSGYHGAETAIVTFTGGGGNTTATATATISNGVVTAVNVVSGGTGYTSSTKVTVVANNGGSGAAVTATVSGGAVTSFTVSQGGSGYLSAPTVLIQDANNPIPVATILAMPTGIVGNALETFSSRGWLIDNDKIIFTAAGNPVDLNPGDGAGVTPSNDSFLRQMYTQVKQANGFLYLVGDSSVNYISNPQTSGTPAVTTFSNLNVDPQIGTPFPDTCQTFARAVVFMNINGVHAVYGGSVDKVSPQLDGLFAYYITNPTLLSSLTPSAACHTLFGVPVYVLLAPIIDLYTGAQRNALMLWDGKKWWTGSQEKSLIFVDTQEVNSKLTAYGTDGTGIYPLFQNYTSSTLQKTAQSKLWGAPSYHWTKRSLRLYSLYNSTNPSAVVNFTVDSSESSASVSTAGFNDVTWVTAASGPAVWSTGSGTAYWSHAAGIDWFVNDVSQAGQLIGITVTTNEPNMTLISASVGIEKYEVRV